MEVDWKKFWKKFWSFTKKAEAEESALANLVALVLFFGGSGLAIYGALSQTGWTFYTGLIGAIIGLIVSKINTGLARCKVLLEEDDKNHPQG